jgi:hypothetical protein
MLAATRFAPSISDIACGKAILVAEWGRNPGDDPSTFFWFYKLLTKPQWRQFQALERCGVWRMPLNEHWG